MSSQPVVVVTGGGGGIGAAIAEHLGSSGWFVAAVDPLVTIDGSERLPESDDTTAGRIIAAGGVARASSASVTDVEAIHALLRSLAEERGRLDAVVNVAGISRPTSFLRGDDEDWRSVLSVHLDGYRNVLGAALPIMAEAGHGRILGVTSGSGWRQADAGAYGCAKRAVAALTWQIGREAPPGVVVNAMSPIAVTRMVTAALGARSKNSSGAPATGGLALGAMPTPAELGPFAAHLVGDDIGWCTGTVFFAGGPEVAVLDAPRLVEVVRTDGGVPIGDRLDQVVSRVLGPAEEAQASTGGSNPRIGAGSGEPPDSIVTVAPDSEVRTCAVVSDRADVAVAVTGALEARGVGCITIPPVGSASPIDDSIRTLAAAAPPNGAFDAVVIALSGAPSSGGTHGTGTGTGWEAVLGSHAGLVEQIHADAGWVRAAVSSGTDGDSVRVVSLVDASTSGGRSRAQAAAQFARAASTATKGRASAFAVAVETVTPDLGVVGELTAHLVCSPGTAGLSGAELVVDDGWFGLRSHPRPGASLTVDADLPSWFDDVLSGILGQV